MKQCCSISDVLHQLHYFQQQYKLILNFLALLFNADNQVVVALVVPDVDMVWEFIEHVLIEHMARLLT